TRPEREDRLAYRLADRLGEVRRLVALRQLVAGRNLAAHRVDAAPDLVDDGDRVGIGLLADADPDRRLAVEVGDGLRIDRAVLDAPDVAQPHGRGAVPGDDQVLEIGDGAELRVGLHAVVDAMALDAPAGNVDVLARDRGEDVARGQAARAQRGAVEPEPDRALLLAEERRRGDAGDRLDLRLQHALHELAHLDHRAVGVDRQPDHGLVAAVLLGDDRRLDLVRELVAGGGGPVRPALPGAAGFGGPGGLSPAPAPRRAPPAP